MINTKKESISISMPGWLIEALEAHIANKIDIDRSTFICKAIRLLIATEKAESVDFWRQDNMEGK